MNPSEIIKNFSENSLILTTHGLKGIVEENLSLEKIISKAKENNVWLITHEFIEEFVMVPKTSEDEEIEKERDDKEEEAEEAKVKVERPSRKIFAKEFPSELKIYENTDITGKSSCAGKIEDFLEYFNQKYANLKEILQERSNLKGNMSIERIKKYPNESIAIIAMIREKRESKRGYKFLEVEDQTGELTVLIPRDNARVNDFYDKLLLDEVIGIIGLQRNNLFIAQEIFEPDLPVSHKPNFAEEPVNVALLSDIHVGNYLFLEKEFNRFIEWLNLKDKSGNRREIAERIKYLVIAGDLVDGIGIYPNQEQELSIPDIYKQYDFLASLLEKIPDYIEIVLSVGNHDAVRNAEPQPTLSKEIAPKLYEIPNVHLVGSPVWIGLNSIKTLVYHGTSLDTIIGSLSDCTYSRPENAMIEYLKKRYLIPIYGNDAMSPEREDLLAIKEIPDIFHCGHVHTNGYANYRGVRVINSGTFQARTKYQEELGHLPTPARVPIVNLQSLEVSVIHF